MIFSESIARLKNFIKDMILPQLLTDFLRLLRNLPLMVKYSGDLKKNKKFKDVKSGKVFILANGPSLKKVNFSALSGHDVITMNDFHRGEIKTNFNVVAYCYGVPSSSPAWMIDNFKDCLDKNQAESHWVHYSSISSAREMQIPVQAVLPAIEASLWRSSAKINLSSLSLGYASSAQLAIQVAMYLGYNDIILLGFDHDWLANRDHLNHFYSNEKDLTDKIYEGSYLKILEMLERLWHLYVSIAISAEKNGIKIINCTRNSHLDVFPFGLMDDFYLKEERKK